VEDVLHCLDAAMQAAGGCSFRDGQHQVEMVCTTMWSCYTACLSGHEQPVPEPTPEILTFIFPEFLAPQLAAEAQRQRQLRGQGVAQACCAVRGGRVFM
jgi:hypothetical protein